MFDFKRLMFFLGNKLRRNKFRGDGSAGAVVEEKWEADFSKPAKSRFDIKSENSYDAYTQKHSLVLALKKSGCIAWINAPEYTCRDQIIEAKLRLRPMGGYAAAGLLFRMIDEGSCYMFLVSSKGYFRLDVVRNNMPFPLVGWTETAPAKSEGAKTGASAKAAAANPGAETGFTVKVTAYGNHLVLFVNGVWAAELSDSTISEGFPGFVLASYEAGPESRPGCTAQAFLDSLTFDSRIAEVEAAYEKWNDSPDIPPESRFALAETFAAMQEFNPALVQLRKIRESRERRGQGAGTQKELLLASRLARQLELYGEAEEYVDACLAQGSGAPEGKEAAAEKAKVLYAAKQFGSLRDYLEEAVRGDDPALHTLMGHALWNLGNYEEAAAEYDRAFELDGGSGLLAKNAANVYEMLGRKEEAFSRFLSGGRAFLAADNYSDLGAIVPKLLSLGKDNWEAHALAGKWAFGIEDWAAAEAEFDLAEELRKAMRPKPHKDPAVIFLKALLLAREGKRRQAAPLFEDAVKYAPDYGLFYFRLAENRFLLDPDDPRSPEDVKTALALIPPKEESYGWAGNLAAQIELHRGNPEAASQYLEKAAALLGEVPAIRVNRAVLFSLRGFLDKALEILESDKAGDPDGLMANCAGNLLVHAGKYEQADGYYRRAILRSPGNTEYLVNRASCLVKLEYYGEADEILSQAHSRAPSPEILELISYVAVKKGEFSRAESAVRSALEMDPDHVPSLLSLGWLCTRAGRWDEAGEILGHLDGLELKGGQDSRDELRRQWENGVYRFAACAACGRSWRMPKFQPPSPSIRLYAMPPGDLPAGSCPECGRTYCIDCAKEHLDENGRFLCPECGKSLKLIDEGLKRLIYDWASKEIPAEPPVETSAEESAETPAAEPVSVEPPPEAPAEPSPAEPAQPESSVAEPAPAEPPPEESAETQPMEPAQSEALPPVRDPVPVEKTADPAAN
ncbi:MAG: tetratricopeptide repeat protein [Treponema sp.]|nr:tetratricopeptide repeat protein [Treponema sp.]